jgi:hypothetical protein
VRGCRNESVGEHDANKLAATRMTTATDDDDDDARRHRRRIWIGMITELQQRQCLQILFTIAIFFSWSILCCAWAGVGDTLLTWE